MPKQIEKQLVEDYIAEKLQGLDWKFVEASELKRESARDPLLIDNSKEAVLRINKNLNLGEEEIKKVVDEYKPDTIFFSTLLYGKKGVLPPRDWWYYIYDIGQHVLFYCAESLKYIGDLLGYNFYTNDIDFHCYSKNNKFEKILKYKEKKIIKLYDRYSGRVDTLQ